jgi:hypothetical protein
VLGSTEEEKQEQRKQILIQNKKTIQQKHFDAKDDVLAELKEEQLLAYLHGAKWSQKYTQTVTKRNTQCFICSYAEINQN